MAIPDPAQTLNMFATPAASPEVLAGLALPDQVTTARVNAGQVDAQVTGRILDMPGGALKVAIGAEARTEELVGDIVFIDDEVDRDVVSAYVEFLVPLFGASNARAGARSLELSVAGRIDDYSDFGSTTNPKFGLAYRPVEWLALRSTYGTSFKAPTLRHLYSPQQSFSTFLVDPVRAETILVDVLVGGNPDGLEPEEGESFNVGATFQPASLPEFELSLDAWRVEESSRIADPFAQTVVDNEELFAGRVVRGPSPAPGEVGPILSVDATTANFGKVEVEGIDLRGSYEPRRGRDLDLEV
jgi:iron complex outermembrane receptor protein